MCFTTVVPLIFLLFALCETQTTLNIHKYLQSLKGKSYRNYALLLGVPNDFEDLAFFNTLELLYNVTFWKKPTLVFNPVEFSISPEYLAQLYRDTEKRPLHFTTLTRNLQNVFDKQKVGHYARGTIQSFNWHSYYRLDDIYDWIKDLSEIHPDEVRWRSIGKSYENRTILSVKLTLKGSIRRSKVIVEGGCHGNEWISPAFVTYMLHTLLNAKTYDNEELETIALMYTWIFVPVMNPDGYEHTHITDRLLRKNRRGVDLNRNYGIAFGAHCPDKSKTESREYCGDSPFSEPESHAMSLFTKENSDNLEYYLSFHSYGQHILLPYSYTIEHKDNYDLVKKKTDLVASRILERHGIKYTIGNRYEVEGSLVSGTSSDWVKRALKVPYVVTFELPDTGVHGYALPPGRILPTCQATLDGLLPFLAPDAEKYFRSGNVMSPEFIDARVVLLCNAALYILNRSYYFYYIYVT